jgi:3-dehydro-L-gulonate 2-dehydrogenase
MAATESVLISPAQMQSVLYEILIKRKVPSEKAKTCADVFTKNSLDGVYSHGINRFPRFMKYIENGLVKVDNDPVCLSAFGAIEQWDGRSGIGITNALAATDRAVELASTSGIGCVALRNTNHWMRAGAYALYATEKGNAFIGWTNTIHNTPAWGATDPRLGNNPLTIGVPFNSNPIILDVAMSQFSYGALDNFRMKGEHLPVPGGYDESGVLTTDPSCILETKRVLPIGYWKGSGLSLLLDILATILSGGLSVSNISRQNEETNVSQVFIVFNLQALENHSGINAALTEIITDVKQSIPERENVKVRYPGENLAHIRNVNAEKGIPVLKNVWDEVEAFK